MTETTLLLIDGHSMAFRSFFALPAQSFVTAQGQYTNAVHGFINTLLRLVADHQPTHIAVAFDLPGGTFRTREYPEYKGGRDKTPEEFKGQVSVIQEVLDVLGVAWLTVEDMEADDIVATLARRGEEEGMKVFVTSGDKDSYQLVTDKTSVIYPMPRSTMQVLDPQGVREKTGVLPERYSDLAALVGEAADNLPGVPGVGPKTAAKWLDTYGSLETLLERAGELKTKAGQSLRDNADQVRLNRKLNQLLTDLPIGQDMEVYRPLGVDREKMHELFDTLDFTSLRARVLRELPMREGSPVIDDEEATLREVVEYHGGTLSLTQFLADHGGPYAIAIDGFGKPTGGSIDRFALAANDGAVYIATLSTLSLADDNTLTAFLADSKYPKIGHGTKALTHAWAQEGRELAGVVADTEISAYLLKPDQRQYDLDDLFQRYIGLDLTFLAGDGTLGISADGQLAPDQLGHYAVGLLDLHDAFLVELKEQQQDAVLINLELNVAHVLFKMEQRGIGVDQDRLLALYTAFNDRVVDAENRAHNAIGDSSVNLSSPKQLQAVLFDQLSLPKTKRTKSGYTTNAEALEDLLRKIEFRQDDKALKGVEFLSALLEHRDAIKLRQSVEGLQKAVMDDGRIHTTYQQTVAATGRLSSTDPNLQNIHARTEEGLQIREVFVPGEGFDLLMTADYSQIEMRLMAHLSEDAELIQAFNDGADLHNYVAARVFHVPENEVSPAQRSRIKAMSYGLVYGLSAFGLAAQLRIPVPEAQKLMDGYFYRFGNVKRYLDSVVEQARKDGYTATILGRRRYLPGLTSTNRQVRESAERMALNAPIQGSAADIIKLAMVEVEAELMRAGLKSQILLQVHDELVLEVVASEADQVEQIVRDCMGKAWKLSVPLSVGIGVGRSWRDAAH
ncbi:MAG: DNA polymerase I [Actinomycetaceae bacterium]|nr:DNA polymerase I [Actinomycetaceae bacterium]